MKKVICGILLLFLVSGKLMAQDNLLALIEKDSIAQKEHVKNAFKSTRVINGQSMELLARGVLDVRILHRFGELSSGANNLFGFDQANMRFGFDYGILNNLTAGIGRSNVGKEWDGFLKFRPVWQSKGPGAFPVSIILVSGVTLSTQPWSDTTRKNYFSSRMGFYSEIIIGRKFSERFSFQLSPIFVHRNLVPLATDKNDVYALGIGTRLKLTKRMAFVADYHYIIQGFDKTIYKDPLSLGLISKQAAMYFNSIFQMLPV